MITPVAEDIEWATAKAGAAWAVAPVEVVPVDSAVVAESDAVVLDDRTAGFYVWNFSIELLSLN